MDRGSIAAGHVEADAALQSSLQLPSFAEGNAAKAHLVSAKGAPIAVEIRLPIRESRYGASSREYPPT